MATIRICDNILEKEDLRTIFAKEGDFKTIKDAVESLAGNDAYAGKLVECYDPETDVTTWEPMCDEGVLSVCVFANGEEADIEYEIKDADEILIFVLPAGGRNGAGILGAIIGVVIGTAFSIMTAGIGALSAANVAITLAGAWHAGLAFGNVGGIILGALAGGVLGYSLGTSLYDMFHKPSGGDTGNLEGKNYPGVKGSKNQSILGKNYPFVLGKHLITPPYVASPYTRSDGKYGEKQSIALAYTPGYAPLRLTEFRLGDLLLAYNKPTVNSPERPTIMSGKFKKPGGDASKKIYEWRVANAGAISGLIASGALVQKSEDYWYPVYIGSGQYSTYSHMERGTRTWYESRSSNVRVSGSSLYNSGTVEYYGEATPTEEEQDIGEILHRWINNDIELEILQQNPDASANWGTVVTQAVMQDEINATPLYVCDDLLGGVAAEYGVTYKGNFFDNGFRNNSVRFSRANPMKIEVELEASNGIYRTYQYSNDGHSETRYEEIPLWYAIQWRPYGAYATDSDAENWRGNDDNPWRTFEHINKCVINGTEFKLEPEIYTSAAHDADLAAHTGNKNLMGASERWIGAKLFNLGKLATLAGGGAQDRISMQRFTAVVDLENSKPSIDNFPTDNYGGANYLRKNILNIGLDDVADKKGPNTNNTIEVRVIRVSPCYLNETKSDSNNYSAKQYCDIVKWNTLTTFTFDRDKLEKDENYTLEKQNIMAESELRKLCVVALKAKADTGGNIQNQLGKFNFVAESFSPTFTEKEVEGVKQVVIQPENITKEVAYYKPAVVDKENRKVEDYNTAAPITEEFYVQLRQEGHPAIKRKKGNNYTKTLLREIFAQTPDEDNRTLLSREIKDKYCDNNAASSAMLALLGMQNGIDALGYEDLNLDSFAEMYEFCKAVYDGSVYPAPETVYNDDLSTESYSALDPVKIKYTCNACVTNAIKVETLLQKCLATGRALYFRDENNRIKVAVDKERKNPVMLINQQNVISGSNTISYDALPSGLQFNFEDESDGFIGHSLYAMNDGEDYRNPTKEIETYAIDYVTNRHQLWSLGRYVMASRSMQRETLVRKIGAEGFCAEIGDLVKVADDTILIGTDLGARVKEIIEDSNYIYGIVTDETWNYTGETEVVKDSEGNETLDENNQPVKRSVQGAEFLQPTKYKQARVVSYRCAMPGAVVSLWRVVVDGNTYTTSGTLTIDGVQYTWIDNSEEQKYFDGHYYERYFDVNGEIIPAYQKTYKMVVGETNVMLFDKKVSKSGEYDGDVSDAQLTYHKPEIDDIVAFGKVGMVTALYTVIKIKPDKDFNFDLTLSQYNDQVYMAGESMPEFAANMTIPDRSGEDNYPLDNSLTPVEVNRIVGFNINAAIDLLSTGEATIQNPDTPAIRRAVAEKDGIQLEIVPLLKKGLSNTVNRVVWQVAKVPALTAVTENDWEDLIEASELTATYRFNRSVDGFPERNDLNGSGENDTKWWLRVKIVNDYGKESEWSVAALVNVDSYGTWIPQIPIVSNLEDNKTTRFLTLDISQPNGALLYATVAYRVGVKRADRTEEPFYLPNIYGDPFGDENTYKEDATHQAVAFSPSTSGAFVEVQRTFKQNVPLIGQNKTVYKNKLSKTAGNGVIDLQTWYTEEQIDSESGDSYDDNGTVIAFAQMSWTTSEGVNTGTATIGEYTYTLISGGELASAPTSTIYTYKIVPYAVETNIIHTDKSLEASVRAEPSTIMDLVNNSITASKLAPDSVVAEKIAAGTITADKMAVGELSAITANMGLITDGAFQGNSNNYWALTNLPEGPNWKAPGTFRVGDDNNYIEVAAYNKLTDEKILSRTQWNNAQGNIEYRLNFKAGTFEVTSQISTFKNDFAIYQDGNMSRLFMTASGMSLQRLVFQQGETIPDLLEQSYWSEHPEKIEDVAKFFADTNGNLIVTNSANTNEIGFATEVPEGVTVYQLNSQFIHTGEFVDLDGVDSKTVNISSEKLATGQSLPFLKRRNGSAETECCDGTIDIPVGSQFMVYNKGCFLQAGNDKVKIDSNTPDTEISEAFNDNISTDWGLTAAQVQSLRMVTV